MEANRQKTSEELENNDEANKQWEDFEKIDEMEQKTRNIKKRIYQKRTIVNTMGSLYDSRSIKGLCGLQNLGNTCFMNSAIQCVSHSIELTNFFLTKEFEKEINPNNKLGLKGKLANAWYRLLESLWVEGNRYTAPSEFKHTIARIASQFSGFGQQDSHELLTFLLDGLHEDLNKISVKPYKEIEEKQDQEDDVSAAERFWDLHLQRNDSVIVDLFHGQYRSTITCPQCHRVSITYDPYTTVPVPIPKLKRVDVYFIPQFNIRKTNKLSIFISEDALFFDIAHYINSNLNQQIGKFRCMVVSNNELVKILKASDNITESTSKGVIFCCEIDPKLLKSDYMNLVVHIKDYKNSDYKSYPRMFTVTSDMTVKDLRLIIYGFMRRYMDIPQSVANTLNNRYQTLENSNLSESNYDEYEQIIKEEFDFIWGDISILEENMRKDIESFRTSLPYDLYLQNKNGEKIKIIDGLEKSLESLSLNDSKSINSSQPMKIVTDAYKNGYRLILDFTSDNYINPDRLKSLQSCVSYASKEKNKQLNLYDCLEHFRLTEKLEKNNEWYCKDCKLHQQAYKKLELFYTPKLLVLHLKRFEYSAMGRYRTYAEKIGTGIDFPIDDLELGGHIVGPDSNPVYELYAVSQHYGSCGGGHYTAICKNGQKWYDFNDSSVSASNSSSVVSPAAYLLFYRRKDQ